MPLVGAHEIFFASRGLIILRRTFWVFQFLTPLLENLPPGTHLGQLILKTKDSLTGTCFVDKNVITITVAGMPSLLPRLSLLSPPLILLVTAGDQGIPIAATIVCYIVAGFGITSCLALLVLVVIKR
jgi:hypothetical protein